MARISSEEAVEKAGNRFDLVIMASHRARELHAGHRQRVEGNDPSKTVTALREIEEGKYTREEWLKSIKAKNKGNTHEHHTP